MKRSELVEGQEYYVGRGKDWETSPYWAERVRIVSTKPHVRTNSWHPVYRFLPGMNVVTAANAGRAGAGVLAVLLDSETGAVKDLRDEVPVARVVSLASIRGPWEETRERVAAAVKAEDERRAVANTSRERRAAAGKALEDRAAAAGYRASWRDCTGAEVIMSGEAFARLLDAANVP